MRPSLALILSLAIPLAILTEQDPLAGHIRVERVRLRAHFDSTDQELKARDVSYLTSEQRAARATLVTWLREYRANGAFPLNEGVAAHATPIFRDSRGVLCAMGYLIERSGRSDIVDDIAANRNEARIHDLADDPRLVAWLDSTGLTVDEAARIQPAYQPPPGSNTSPRVSADYAVASLAFSGTSIAAATVNIVAPSRMSGFAGLVTGGLAMAVGLSRLDGSVGTKRLAHANVAIGAISLGAAIRGFTARKPEPARPVTGSRARFDNVKLAPSVTEALGKAQVGLVVSARF